MIVFIVLFIFIMILFYKPHLRNIVLHPCRSLYYGTIDIYNYIRYKKYNECKFYGKIIAFCSASSEVFGCGKTLTAVYKVICIYKQYNNKLVYDKEHSKFVKQRIRILSNIELKTIDYEPLNNTQQIIKFHESLGTCDVGIVFIDETSSLFNSRDFKTNISPDLLKSMCTCRHTHFGMIFTAPRFNQIDALMRQICSEVHMCSKSWRSEVVRIVDAYELEYCTNLKYIESTLYRYFVPNWLYESYDTDDIVNDIKKQHASGEHLSDDEVLQLQGDDKGTYFNVGGTRKFKKLLKGK